MTNCERNQFCRCDGSCRPQARTVSMRCWRCGRDEAASVPAGQRYVQPLQLFEGRQCRHCCATLTQPELAGTVPSFTVHCHGIDEMSPEGQQAIGAMARAAAAQLSPAERVPNAMWVLCMSCAYLQCTSVVLPMLLRDAGPMMKALRCQRCGARSNRLTIATPPESRHDESHGPSCTRDASGA